jgi:hypothetical protein
LAGLVVRRGSAGRAAAEQIVGITARTLDTTPIQGLAGTELAWA